MTTNENINVDKKRASSVGSIPSSWMVCKLSSVSRISYGISDPIDRSIRDGVKIISLPNVNKDGKFNENDIPYVDSIKVNSEDILSEGDILFNWRNGSSDHIGKTMYFRLSGTYTHVGFFLKIRVNRKTLNPLYLNYHLKYIKILGYFSKSKIQVNNTFNKEELGELDIVIPPLPEQQKIAEILGTWDTAIEQLETLIEKKQLLKRGLMQKLLTGKVRFPEFEGEAWSSSTLKTIVEKFIVPMRDKPKALQGDIPWCRIEDFESMYLNGSKTNQFVNQEIVKEMNLKVNPVGTVLVSCSANLGRCAIVATPLVTNQTFIGLVPKLGKISSEYLYYLMISMSSSLNKLSSGTTISYLSRQQFEDLKVYIPSLLEQSKIIRVLIHIDDEISNLFQQLEALKTQKLGLMQQLLTGKIRVQVDEPTQAI